MKIRKAVIPAAGFGTRFLPVTRTIPKVMLPVLNEPAIQFSVREAADAGIEHIVFVISRGQEATNDYFHPVPSLEQALEERGNTELLSEMQDISSMVETSVIYQDEQLGLGHAVLMAKDEIGDEPFAVFLPDDIIFSDSPVIGEMMSIFNEHGGSVIAVRRVSKEAVPNLGIIDPEPLGHDVYRIKGMVEKPTLEKAPSDLAIVARYLLTPEIFDILEETPPGARGEIQLTDALEVLRSTPQGTYAYDFVTKQGAEHFDAGVPLGMLKASIYAALKREDMAAELKEWLKPIINT